VRISHKEKYVFVKYCLLWNFPIAKFIRSMIHQFKYGGFARIFYTLRAFKMNSRWQARTVKPAITSISVML